MSTALQMSGYPRTYDAPTNPYVLSKATLLVRCRNNMSPTTPGCANAGMTVYDSSLVSYNNYFGSGYGKANDAPTRWIDTNILVGQQSVES